MEEEPTILNSEKPEENWLFKLDDVDKEAFLALPGGLNGNVKIK